MADYTIDVQSMTDFLVGLLNTPSPTGFHELAIDYCEQAFSELPLTLARSKKGALLGTLDGSQQNAPRGLTAHVDTLGAMVSHIKSDGRLKLTQLGGWSW